MVDQAQLEASRTIQRRTGRTFYFATRLLPEYAREATYVLYAFFRVADDIVDDPNPPPASVQRQRLDRIRREALGERDSTDPVLAAFATVRAEYDIPAHEVEEFMAAMEQDVAQTRYTTYADLEAYLRGSSVAVANMMLAVMDPAMAERARPHAKALGEAFQLTNFLRDVREDVLDYGRIYLPKTTLDRYGVTYEQIEQLDYSEEFAAAIQWELQRTESIYRQGVDGIQFLPEGCRFAVLLAAVLYVDHHRLIRSQNFDVLSSRPSLGRLRRVELFLKTWWRWRRTRDPRATFESVSAVGSPADGVDDDTQQGGGFDEDGAQNQRGSMARRVVGKIRSLNPVGGQRGPGL